MSSTRPRWLSRRILWVLIGASAAVLLASTLWVAVGLALTLVALGTPAIWRGCDRWLNAPADPSTIQLDEWGREYALLERDLPEAEVGDG